MEEVREANAIKRGLMLLTVSLERRGTPCRATWAGNSVGQEAGAGRRGDHRPEPLFCAPRKRQGRAGEAAEDQLF